MQRRQFMKAALAATAATMAHEKCLAQSGTPKPTTVAPGPLPWMQGLDGGNLPPVNLGGLEDLATPAQSFFTARQRGTLARLSDVLVPASNGHPGAIQAEVPAFLDFFVGKSFLSVQLLYREGLDDLNAEALRMHRKPFADLTDAEVDAILKPRLAAYMHDHYPTDQAMHFLAAAHEDIRMATRNSPAWAAASAPGGKPAVRGELFWHPVDPDPTWASSPGEPCHPREKTTQPEGRA